jgi:hypothetical protein
MTQALTKLPGGDGRSLGNSGEVTVCGKLLLGEVGPNAFFRQPQRPC